MLKNALLTGAGILLLAFGAVGLFLPIWPTTPFVLLSAACLSGSPALRAKIMRIGFFQEHFENYKSRRGLSKKTVVISLGYLWGMLALSMAFASNAWLLLCGVGAVVTIHILCMARRKEKTAKQPRAY